MACTLILALICNPFTGAEQYTESKPVYFFHFPNLFEPATTRQDVIFPIGATIVLQYASLVSFTHPQISLAPHSTKPPLSLVRSNHIYAKTWSTFEV
jgi:hypothetical protein